MSELKRTPLFPEYEKHGAKTIDFGGWDMPVQFSGINHEHAVTRTKAGLFDVSHMGEIVVSGPKSHHFLQKLTTNDVSKLTPNKAQYTFMCYEDGGVVDDFLIYMLQEDYYLLVVNAANTVKDLEWLNKHHRYPKEELVIEDVTNKYVQLAIQGPKAESILQKLTNTELSSIRFFSFLSNVRFKGIETEAIVSRTGYTGEDGFEIYIPMQEGSKLWQQLLEIGKEDGMEPIGLGARDTLRFEANLPLYGQELSKDITPIEAGLNFAVKIDKDIDFIGKDVLKQQVENGTDRKLVGIEMIDRGIPRHGYTVLSNGQEIGYITSGTKAPTLNKSIGLALIKADFTEVGTELEVQMRKSRRKAVVIKTPFLKKNS